MVDHRETILNLILIFVTTAAIGSILGISILRLIDFRLSDISINVPSQSQPVTSPAVETPDIKESDESDSGSESSLEPLKFEMTAGAKSKKKKSQKIGGADSLVAVPKSSNDVATQCTDLDCVCAVQGENCVDKSYTQKEYDVRSGITSPITLKPHGTYYLSENQDFRSNKDYNSARIYNVDNTRLAQQFMQSNQPIYTNVANAEIDHYSISKDYLPAHPTRQRLYHDRIEAGDIKADSGHREYYDDVTLPDQYYKNPTDMTPRQLMKFKVHAKLDKMTPIDYINWLTLFINSPQDLNLTHQKNLNKLNNGIPLTLEDIPKSQHLPKSSRQYYEKMRKFGSDSPTYF